jgi:hypothetical protein
MPPIRCAAARFVFDGVDHLSHVGRVDKEIVRWDVRLFDPLPTAPSN